MPWNGLREITLVWYTAIALEAHSLHELVFSRCTTFYGFISMANVLQG